MTTHADNNKRIAKNTAMLYMRTCVNMAVMLYTSRVVLQVLGVTDYGIFNVVGGFVALFGFINGSLSSASSRFLAFDIGRGDHTELRRTFNSIVTIHYLFAALILVLAETVGLWFVMNKLVIPPERAMAAMWVYQSAVVSAVLLLASMPFNALIIARERMGAFAYISMGETVAKLVIVLILPLLPADRLIVYALLFMVVQCAFRIVYQSYCKRHFAETAYHIEWDRAKSREILSYASWTVGGSLAYIGNTQGVNVLLNLFFGPAVNAARGIAVQVQSAINQFFAYFQMAANPQITKTYAQGDLDYMHKLLLASTRYSFFLILIFALPFLFHAEYILQLWLGQVPAHSANFVRIMVFIGMNYSLSGTTVTAIRATGDIKKYQTVESLLLLAALPIAYMLLKLGRITPEQVLLTVLGIDVVTQFVRVGITYPRIGLNMWAYLRQVMFPIAKVCAVAWVAPYVVFRLLPPHSWQSFVCVTLTSVVSAGLCAYLLGTTRSERQFISQKLKQIIR